ncbi:hypothetical protein AMATHDRAFT_6423 [Amanita thiersii Skay4041]|uniref:Peptidase S8/S53 domain-containing protein n=1 Tax=Amanita thiersii Skay4041 TaxID=703135 RepID=A0A2A9NHN1_9AGAR|nr:hypothetical protein AMATHDRAFT_6423 [Amanita thiersii Skay4041]
MRFSVFALLALFAAPGIAGPTPLRDVLKYSGSTTGKYLVKLKSTASKAALINQIRANATITHDWTLLNGFAGHLDEHSLNILRASDDVERISEDGIMHTMTVQTDATWGLQRISNSAPIPSTDPSALTYDYTYTATGSGVDIYIVDTGIFIQHTQFGGRARWGTAVGSYNQSDGNGHGTHCAGIAAGSQFGVAKQASLIAVKVLSDLGTGSIADIVTGLDWVQSQVQSSGRPSVVSMSLGGGLSLTLNDAVASLTGSGIHVAVAAGNSNVDCDFTSPASEPTAITVGATQIDDYRAGFSNYGRFLDVFAAGNYVISSFIGSTTATKPLSGTSMATPHVAGMIAYIISRDGNSSPADMSSKIAAQALKNALSDVPDGTVNYLAQIGR